MQRARGIISCAVFRDLPRPATSRHLAELETRRGAHAGHGDFDAQPEQRLAQLDSRTSLFNPLWYGLSYGIGAAAGLAGDRWSLGFVAETEQQVCEHLREHLAQLPADDTRSRAILEQMIIDEEQHGKAALDAGGMPLPAPAKWAMAAVSQVMKKTTYRL